ncbi:MAG: PIN domain nuclease [Bacteroidetes bacterium QH_1_64_81]|nr:MAG: PIN domain nuclease [Bacteroidetes bacterium QH_1_64_81]
MLLDSNLIIYASRPAHSALRAFIARQVPFVSAVSKVETLGYPDLTEEEKQFLEAFFDAAEMLPVSQPVITQAIQLRQQRRMSLGDALIGGTALSRDLRLATHNTEDFAWVEELEIIDPLDSDQ